jgi:hypothetical protein
LFEQIDCRLERIVILASPGLENRLQRTIGIVEDIQHPDILQKTLLNCVVDESGTGLAELKRFFPPRRTCTFA